MVTFKISSIRRGHSSLEIVSARVQVFDVDGKSITLEEPEWVETVEYAQLAGWNPIGGVQQPRCINSARTDESDLKQVLTTGDGVAVGRVAAAELARTLKPRGQSKHMAILIAMCERGPVLISRYTDTSFALTGDL